MGDANGVFVLVGVEVTVLVLVAVKVGVEQMLVRFTFEFIAAPPLNTAFPRFVQLQACMVPLPVLNICSGMV